jgi:predicted nucleic acid-binding protein
LDTNVVRAALCSPSGASAALLRACARRLGPVPLASVPLALEYEEVCTRPATLAAAALDEVAALAFVDGLLALCEPVRLHFLWRPQLADPADEFVLEAAANGRAAALVTHNARHFAAVASRFGLEVLAPAEALRRIP